MALNPNPIGKSIADYLWSARTSGSPITEAELENQWIEIMTLIYDDLQANLGVLPGSFEVTGVQAGSSTIPVTGVGGPAQ